MAPLSSDGGGEDVGAKLPSSQFEQKNIGFTQYGVPAAYTQQSRL